MARHHGDPNEGARYEAHWTSFSSLHVGDVVLFVYGDGSVRGLSKEIEEPILDALATIQGEEVVDASQP
jgi:hypothetical protein